MEQKLKWDCPKCNTPNVDYFPLPSLEVLCEHCGFYWDVDEAEETGIREAA